jgi:hypothetical protein
VRSTAQGLAGIAARIAARIAAHGSWLTHPGGTPGSLNVTNWDVALTGWISDDTPAKDYTEEAAPRSEA